MATVARERQPGPAALLRWWRTRRELAVPYFFLGPTVVLVVLFFAIPAVLILAMSLTNLSTATGLSNWSFVGLQNYRRSIMHPSSGQVAGATIFYVVMTLTFFNVGLGLLLALLTTHVPRKAGFFFRALWLLPRVTPVVVYVLMWKFMAEAHPFGIINSHVAVPILDGSGANLLPSFPWTFVILMSGFIGASFGMIIFTSAIESIPPDYMNAALVDGAGVWQRMRFVVLPALKWPLLFVATYQTLSLFTSFEYIFALTQGSYGTRVWSLWAYQAAFSNYFGNFLYGLGAALAVVLVIIGAIAALAYMKFFKFEELVQEPKIEAL